MRKFSFLFTQSDYEKRSFKVCLQRSRPGFLRAGMFNGCTGYELWDIGHLSSTMSEHGTLRWWEITIVLFGWVASRLWKQINISAGAGCLWCWKMMTWTPSWSQCKHAKQEILKRRAEIPFFFYIFGSTVSNQLFISPPLLSLFLPSEVSRLVLHGFLEAPFVCASSAYTVHNVIFMMAAFGPLWQRPSAWGHLRDLSLLLAFAVSKQQLGAI